jgi:hypothetical protein
VYWENAKLGKTVKRILPWRSHIEALRGTPKQAMEYCKKGGDFQEFGVAPKELGQQKGIDRLLEVYEKEGLMKAAQMEKKSFMRFGGGLERLDMMSKRITSMMLDKKIVWIYGPSGSGKTRLGFELCLRELRGDPRGIFKWDAKDLSFLNGYVDQEIALVDDYKYREGDSQQLLNISDQYCHSVPVKGGYRRWDVKFLVFTALYPPRTIFAGYSGPVEQFERRITDLIRMTGSPEDWKKGNHRWRFERRDGKDDDEVEKERKKITEEMLMSQTFGLEEDD